MRIPASCFSSLLMALVLFATVPPSMAQKTETKTTADGGKLEKDYDKDGHLVHSREYDKDGKLILKTVTETTTSGGRIDKVYGPDDHFKYSTEYDKDGKPVHSETPAPWGAATTDWKNGVPVESSYYDSKGKLFARAETIYSSSGGLLGGRHDWYYDDGVTVKFHWHWNIDGSGFAVEYDRSGNTTSYKKQEKRKWYEFNSKTNQWDPCTPDFPPVIPPSAEPTKVAKDDDEVDPEILDSLKKHFGDSEKKIEDETKQEKLKKEREQKKKAEKDPNKQQGGRPVPQPTVVTTVGIVVPAHGAGMISGIITTEPESYKGVPGLQVVTAAVPLPRTPDGKPTLQNSTVDTGGGASWPADQPITFPASLQTEISLIPAGSLGLNVPLRVDLEPKLPVIPSNEITTPPACFPGNISAVHGMGRFSGDSSKIVVLFGNQRITPIAANEDGFFFRVPADAPQGARNLVFVDRLSEGGFAGGTQVAVMTLHTGVAQPVLRKGQRTEGVITLQADGIPAEAWQGRVGADPELVDLAAIRQSAPGFEPPREGQPGTILLAIQNQSPETISIAGFKGTTQVYSLSRHSLPFNTRLGIHATRAGSFNINVIAQPFLAPARFQEFRRALTR